MAARIRHIALCVKDIKETADFYEKAFGLKRTEIKEGEDPAFNCYMSDGEIDLGATPMLFSKARKAPACRKAGPEFVVFGLPVRGSGLQEQQEKIGAGRRDVLLRSGRSAR